MQDRFGHGLGRITSPPDPRDRLFLATERFGDELQEPTRRHRKHYTQHTRHFNQGNIGRCTMFSLAHIIAAGPITQRPYRYQGAEPHFDTIAGYCRAQEIDKATYGWREPTFCEDRRRAGGVGDWGATMRSAAQVARELGFIEFFWHLQTPDEIALYVTNKGPAWLGTVWTSSMSTPDSKGFIRPNGAARGGHAYVIDEVVWHRLGDKVKHYWMLNSWAPWGIGNRAKMEPESVADLMARNGEALAVTEVRKVA